MTTTFEDGSEGHALVVYQGEAALVPRYSAEEGMEQIRRLQALVNTYLRPSTPGKVDGDYGIIPGTEKPTLLKPGADKLCDIYGLMPVYDFLAREVDYSAGFIAYEVRCRLVRRDSGVPVGEGAGACNSRESRYQDTVWWNERGAPPRDLGWTETKKGGKWFRKVPNDNPADLVNTILKMAKKRALIDAVLSVTRSSGLFTQDLEDRLSESARPATPAQAARLDKAFSSLGWDAAAQLAYLRTMLSEAGAEACLTDLRARYRTAQAASDAAPPTADGAAPSDPTPASVDGEFEEI